MPASKGDMETRRRLDNAPRAKRGLEEANATLRSELGDACRELKRERLPLC